MTDEEMAVLVTEFREDFQIPPYYPEYVLKRALQLCAARLTGLKRDADFVRDLVGRGPLKNHAYYEFYHNADEFMKNYGPDVRTWQLNAEVPDAEEG